MHNRLHLKFEQIYLQSFQFQYEDREEKVKDMMQTKDQELDYLRKQIEDMRSKVEDVFKENVDLKQEVSVFSLPFSLV